MGGFHDQYGNYRPDLAADAQKVEIDRLRAELAEVRAELEAGEIEADRAYIEKLEQVQAELAKAHEGANILVGYVNLHRDRQLKAEAELATANVHRDAAIASSDAFAIELAEAKARIRELEDKLSTAVWSRDHERADNGALRKRIAELETERAKLSSFHDMLTKLSHALARAERAEARIAELEAALEHNNSALDGANAIIAKLERGEMTDTFERWKRCPSTHCERRGECASPHECIIKPKPPELKPAARAESAEAKVAELEATFKCKYRNSGIGGNDPQDCAWPECECDPAANGPDGRNLAVIYCMERAEEDVKLLREALEGMMAVVEGRFDGNPHADIDALAKARAALRGMRYETERAEAERDALQKVLHTIWENPTTASWILELIEASGAIADPR